MSEIKDDLSRFLREAEKQEIVMSRQSDGRWLIVSEIFMDARDDSTYVES